MGHRHRFAPRIATFNKPHNWVKTSVLVLLDATGANLPLADIAVLSACKYHSLAVLLPKYARWKYVHQSFDSKRNCSVYSIARRGRDFLDYRAPPPLRQYFHNALRLRLISLQNAS